MNLWGKKDKTEGTRSSLLRTGTRSQFRSYSNREWNVQKKQLIKFQRVQLFALVLNCDAQTHFITGQIIPEGNKTIIQVM